MFELTSMSEIQEQSELPTPKTPKSGKKPKPKERVKAKPHGLPELNALVSSWRPSNPEVSRRLLVNEIRDMLEENHHACIRSCIPALIVDGVYPIDLMHYRTEQDIDEFMTRMLWMRQEFDAVIGIILGVEDEDATAMIADIYENLLNGDKDCIILVR